MLHSQSDLIDWAKDCLINCSDSTSVWSDSEHSHAPTDTTTELSTLSEITFLFDPLVKDLSLQNTDCSSQDELWGLFDNECDFSDQKIANFEECDNYLVKNVYGKNVVAHHYAENYISGQKNIVFGRKSENLDGETLNIDEIMLQFLKNGEKNNNIAESKNNENAYSDGKVRNNRKVLERAKMLLQEECINFGVAEENKKNGNFINKDQITENINEIDEHVQMAARNESQDSRFTFKTDDTVIYFQEIQKNEFTDDVNSHCSCINSEMSFYNEDETLNSSEKEFELPPITSRLWDLWLNANKQRPELIDKGLGVISVFKDFEKHLINQIMDNESFSPDKLVQPQKTSENNFFPITWTIPLVDSKECQKLSLQEACQVHRSTFVRNSIDRQRIIRESVFEKLENDYKTDNKNMEKNNYGGPINIINGREKRRISKEEMKAQNARICVRLPEVMEKNRELKRQEFYSRNRQQVQLYNQKIQQRLFSRAAKYSPKQERSYLVLKRTI